jgi:hypothetical protein
MGLVITGCANLMILGEIPSYPVALVNNRKTVKTVMTLTFLKEQQVVLNHPLSIQPLSPSYQIKV